ncbi:hypothetical protein SmJEL517_g02297 [Synchytrium microbalum]|uniref:AD domain-containing protein n=1 Tax=Synchytrium microbalum TaxID=1806994 RepID=A0A507C6V8_9FUNG|nr:uncharacterized protein SmJEL517_g02297 [Synchytrium microbalum]TPX35241.1 hypothetical protein SmJEL517_g02297 [Synchytrium microbalum]
MTKSHEDQVKQAQMEGTWVKATTINGQLYEGLIFSFDEISKLLVLQSPPTTPVTNVLAPMKYDFHLLKISFIKEITPLSPPSHIIVGAPALLNGHASTSQPANSGSKTLAQQQQIFSLAPITPIPLDKIQQREAAALRAEQQKLSRINVGAGEQGQVIFDTFAKTMKTKWIKDSIVVADEVVIPPPYIVEGCKFVDGKKHDAGLLERVKVMLDAQRKKMGLT